MVIKLLYVSYSIIHSTFSCLWNFQTCELRLLLVLKSARQKSHLCLIPTIWVSTCILMWLFFLFRLSHPGLEHAHKVWPNSSTILYIIVSSSASNCSAIKQETSTIWYHHSEYSFLDVILGHIREKYKTVSDVY